MVLAMEVAIGWKRRQHRENGKKRTKTQGIYVKETEKKEELDLIVSQTLC